MSGRFINSCQHIDRMDVSVTKWSILEPLIFEREFVHLEEISRRVGRAHSFIRKYLNEFVEFGILEKKRVGRMIMYRINNEFPLLLDILVLIEKEKVLRAKGLIIREIIYDLRNILAIDNFSLIFGSAVRGTKRAGDIDILVVGELGVESKKELGKLERKVNKSIHLIEIESLGNVSDALKEEIRKSHLIIQGSENIVKWLI